jgi:hypothetical protein
MATKKTVKSNAVKKTASKKKSPANKKSTVKSSQSIVRENLDRDIDSSNEEMSTPSYHPTNVDESTKKSGNPIFRFLIIAGLILIAVIVYSQFSKGNKKETATTTPSTTTNTTTSSVQKPVETPPSVAKEETSATTSNSKLNGFNLEKIATGKTLVEAKEHCKSLSSELPSNQELKDLKASFKDASLPKELQGSDLWALKENLKFNFATGKGLDAKANEKLSVVCKK